MPLGKNIASSEGAVVLREPLYELLQYKPITSKVKRRPLLLVFSPLNKFYVLDLAPGRSHIQQLMRENFRVFVLSWKVVDSKSPAWGLADYVDAVTTVGSRLRAAYGTQAHLVGYCYGGLISRCAAVLSTNFATITTLSTATPSNHQVGFRTMLGIYTKSYADGNILTGSTIQEVLQPMISKKVKDPLVAEWSLDLTNVTYNFFRDVFAMSQNNAYINGQFRLRTTYVSPKLTIPHFNACGKYDKLVNAATVQHMHTVHENNRLLVINAGHFMLGSASGFAMDGGEEQSGSWEVEWMAWLHKWSPDETDDTRYVSPSLGPAPGIYVQEKFTDAVPERRLERVVRDLVGRLHGVK